MTKGERKKNKTVIHEFIYLYVLVCEFQQLPATDISYELYQGSCVREEGERYYFKIYLPLGTSLVIQRLRLCAFNLGSEGSIPGEGSRIPHTSWDNQNKINKSWKCFAEQWTTNQKLAIFFFLAKIETRKKVQSTALLTLSSIQITEEISMGATQNGEGNGNPLQYSCLENPIEGGAWGLQSMGSLGVGHD